MSAGTSSLGPAVTRTTLCSANIGMVRSSTSSRRGVLGEIAIVEADDLGLPLPPSREDLGKRAGALGHQPGVGPVNEHGAAIGLWRLDEARDG